MTVVEAEVLQFEEVEERTAYWAEFATADDAGFQITPASDGKIFREAVPLVEAWEFGVRISAAEPIEERIEEWAAESQIKPEDLAATVLTPDEAGDGERMATAMAENENRVNEERQTAEQKARHEGWTEGLAHARTEAAEMMLKERERLTAQADSLLRSFAASRDSYLHRLEHDASRLALAMASRILRREVEIDPLALTGAVRVALGQLAASTEVRLFVPARDEAMWREAMQLIPGLAHRPAVVADQEMKSGDCRIETELGSADLGFVSQLAVMEQAISDVPLATIAGPRVRPEQDPLETAAVDGVE